MNIIEQNMRISKRIALGGVVTLLNILSLYLMAILPTNRLFFFWLSTIFISGIVIEAGVKWAWISFVATSILGFLIIPSKLVMVPYILYFGYYGIVKYFIEKINKLAIEWIIKLLIFNGATYMIYLVAKSLLLFNLKTILPIWLILVLLEVGFIVYDIFYSVMIKYYIEKLRKIINRA